MKNKTPEQILQDAARLVERGWCVGHAAIDRNGDPCDQLSSEAVAWSAMGALEAAAGGPCPEATRKLSQAMRDSGVSPVYLPVQWNDFQEDARDVAAMLRKAATTAPNVTRWVITRIDRNGDRILAEPRQGRYTYATEEEAQATLDAMRANSSADTLRSVFGDVSRMAVRPCPCYPGHFDPQKIEWCF